MKNRKGFTMVELLVTIVILGVLSTFAILGVTRLINKSKNEEAVQSEKALKMAAESYYQSNKTELPKAIGETKRIDASDLKAARYLKSVLKDSKGNDCTGNSYVIVHKKSKTDFSYDVYMCGAKEGTTKSIPTIAVYFTADDENNTRITDNTDLKNHLQQARLHMILKGGVEDGVNVPIDGYSYIIYAKTEDESEFTEVFNSGTLDANDYTEITVDRPLTEYLDVTVGTEFRVKVTVINKKGAKATEDKNPLDYTKGNYNDKVNPKCSSIDGEASENSWISKTTGGTRTITATCTDGEGSGCIRDTFTRTWPNNNQKYGAEYSYILVEDNATNTSVPENFVTTTDPCDIVSSTTNKCRVRVNVDIQSPKIVVNKAPLKEKVTADDSHTVVNINEKSYENSVNDWLNDTNYHNGIEFTVNISDNIHLASYKWEVNAKDQTAVVQNANIAYDTKSNENKSKTYGNNTTKPNCGILTDTIKIGFVGEGKRQGRLTVKDKAGNTTTVYITAFLDRTPPTVPKTNLYKWNKWENVKTGPTSSSNLNPYTNGQWLRGKVFTEPSSSTDSMSGMDQYQYKTTGVTTNESKVTAKYKNIEAEGTSYIVYRAFDKARNYSEYNDPSTIRLDRTPPTNPTITMKNWEGNADKYRPTSLEKGKALKTTYKDKNWSNLKVYTQASGSTDSLSGGVRYQYTTTGKTKDETNTEKQFRNVEEEGVSYIKYRACDAVYNCTEYFSRTINLDFTNPVIKISKITSTTSGYKNKKVKVTFTVSDNLSPKADLRICASHKSCTDSDYTNKNVSSLNITFTGDYDGKSRTAYVGVKDLAGNIGTAQDSSYKVYKNCSENESDGKWKDTTNCTKPCNTGTKKQKSGSVDKHLGGKCSTVYHRTVNCNTMGCCSKVTYVDGSKCSKPCNSGTKNRLAYSYYDGRRCSGSDKSSGGSVCNTRGCCSKTYSKTTYSKYGSCSQKKCGSGEKCRTVKVTQYSSYNDTTCRADTSSECITCYYWDKCPGPTRG